VISPKLRSRSSTLRWFYTPGFDVTRRLLAGEIPVSHQGLDEAALAAPNPVKFVRAKLVAAGVLEPRDEHSARFATWHATAVLRIPAGPDRAHVRAYATWRAAHQLARTVQRRGEASESSQKYARSLVSEAISLVLWLHEDQLELADLRQDLVDQWIAAGSGMRRRVRLFLGWLARSSVTSGLTVEWDDRVPTREAIADEQRFAILRRLLHDDDIDLRDRFAGSVLLLYGKPLTKIAQLRSADLNTTAEGIVTLRLGRGETPLPEPLGMIALALQTQQLQRIEAGDWLFPGRHAGQHLIADTLLQRLKRYGIDRSREGRHAALLALAARLPAPILAERIGIDRSRAAAWVRLAGVTYAGYVAVRRTPPIRRVRRRAHVFPGGANEQLSRVVDWGSKKNQAATLSSVVVSSSVTLIPSLNVAPSSSSLTSSAPLIIRQRSWAASSSL